jgi:hypothetical protein
MPQQFKISGVATSIKTVNGLTEIVYHSTPVVSFNDKVITLNTGGWFTNTTKTRMNQASHQFNLGFSVYQKEYNWFVDYKGKTLEFNGNILTLLRGV